MRVTTISSRACGRSSSSRIRGSNVARNGGCRQIQQWGPAHYYQPWTLPGANLWQQQPCMQCVLLCSSNSSTVIASVNATSAAQAASPGALAGSNAATNRQGEWEEEIEETLKLVQLLPRSVRGALENHSRLYELLEVVMDLGRSPLARFPRADERLSDAPVTLEDLDYATQQVGEFGGDNRAGIDATLHRISCMRNRAGRIVGLTCRVGRAIHGSAGLVADLVAGGASVLFMGRPGVGKTTAIRELSRLLADELARRVVIVDTSNEIGGDGDVPHAGIGRARRMQVPDPEQQHRIMIEAVENHMPQVVVIDEIGTEAECAAARTIAQRGVQLVATAHGNELQNLIKNPALSDLVGGIQSVTLGDDEAKRRGVQKSILERAAPPTFDVAVEMLERHRWHVYADVAAAVDALLSGNSPVGQMRERAADGSILKYSYSQRTLQDSKKGSNGSSSSNQRVLPEIGAGSSSSDGELQRPGSAAAAGGSSAGGFLRSRSADEADTAGSLVTRRGRAVRLGCTSPAGALLRLYCHELDEERLWEVMTAMALHDKIWLAPYPSEADAVLAVRSRVRADSSLRSAAKEAGVPVYAVKSSSNSNLVRAFRTLLGLDPSAGSLFAARASDDESSWGPGGNSPGDSPADSMDESADREGDGDQASSSSSSSRRGTGGPARAMMEEDEALEEARLAVEQIVVPLQQPVELLPRSELVRKAQVALCGRYRLAWELVGRGTDARLRILPQQQLPLQPGNSGAASAAAS